MKDHLYESFTVKLHRFERAFSLYLQEKEEQRWQVKRCTYENKIKEHKVCASCLFERQDF